MKAKIIVITGPVGVGKSTVIKALTHLSKREGFKTTSMFIKAFHGPSYLLWKILEHITMLKDERNLAPWFKLGKAVPTIAQHFTVLSAYFDSIYIPLIMLRVLLTKFFGNTVFIEEYLLSTLLDYIYSFYRHKINRRLYYVFPVKVITSLCIKYKPDLIVLLDANIYEIKRHWHIRGYGDPQMSYVFFQKQFLPKLAYAFYEKRVMEFNVALASATEIAQNILNKIR